MLVSKDEIIDRIHPLADHSRERLTDILSEQTFPKGHLLLKAGKVENKLYFIRKGIVRAYSLLDGNELTFWFGMEGETVISMKSYIHDRAGYENVELLEDCYLYQIETDRLKALFSVDIGIANWGRRLAENELIKTEERLISREFKTASERYTELITTTPALIRRVPLKHIASYLGITQVSLSRIRAEIR